MGFFNALKNIALGKPVFTPQQQGSSQPAGAAQVPSPQSGPKVLPSAFIERIECRTHGTDMEVEVIIQNYAHEELLLDKITFLGKTLFLNGKQLSPGEEEEEIIYEGDRPRSTSGGPCILYYKNEAGDYFASYHNVEYDKLPDNTYKIRYIKFMPPVRDV